MADLLQEVDDAMRQERMMQFWKDYAPFIVTLIIGAILLTGGISAYNAWNASQKEEQTATLLALQNAPEYPGNIVNADLTGLRGGLKGMGYLSAASLLMQNDQFEDAFTLYSRTAEDTDIPKDLRALGILMTARLAPSRQNVDMAPILEKLKDVAGSSSNPFAPHAHIELAILSANTDLEQAQAHLNTVLETAGLPESLYIRAKNLNTLYALKNQSQNKE